MKLKVTDMRKDGITVESRLKYLTLIPTIILAAASAYLCYKGLDGWGWMLFGAIIISGA